MSPKQISLSPQATVADMKRQIGATQIVTIGRNDVTGQTFLHVERPISPYDLIALLLQLALGNVAQIAKQASMIVQPPKEPKESLHIVPNPCIFMPDDNGICVTCGKSGNAHQEESEN